MNATLQQTTTHSVRDAATAAKAASRILAPLSEARRNAALEAIAVALDAARDTLFAANAEDLRLAPANLPASTLARLKLDDRKLAEMIAQVRSVATLPDPLNQILEATELDNANPTTTSNLCHPDPERQSSGEGPASSPATELSGPTTTGAPCPSPLGTWVGAPQPSTTTPQPSAPPGLHLQKLTVPLGVLAVIFEARPDAVTQIASLALKSGNAVILKAGKEVERTAEALVAVLTDTLQKQALPPDAISLVEGREQVAELLAMHSLVDMVIPRGSKSLVEYVQANTRIPVLGHAEGVCHIYVDQAADQQLALRVILDAKCDYPAACNAVETVLIHRSIADEFLPKLATDLRARHIAIHACEGTRELLLALNHEEHFAIDDWHTEYGDLALSIGLVDSVDAAIDHIHTHGSSHTESIITRDKSTADRFLREVDAAGVFHNASTRFADGFRYGFGAEVGISTSKFHARGPVGLPGLTTYKYVLRGHGHTASDYRGPNARTFTHRKS